MKRFSSFLLEGKDKTAVLLFGRMNPITSGHEENVNAAHDIATSADGHLHIVASGSHDEKKNPLSPEQKQTHLNRAFGHLENTTITTASKTNPTIMHHASEIAKTGAKHLVIAGGGDRAEEYKTLLNKYNGVKGKGHGEYNFDTITVKNTGERKAGVSGTDMRQHAASGNFNQFRAGLPSQIQKNVTHSKEIYNDVRNGMNIGGSRSGGGGGGGPGMVGSTSGNLLRMMNPQKIY
jgi:hypothetical protein